MPSIMVEPVDPRMRVMVSSGCGPTPVVPAITYTSVAPYSRSEATLLVAPAEASPARIHRFPATMEGIMLA